jgi:hypothetical protein
MNLGVYGPPGVALTTGEIEAEAERVAELLERHRRERFRQQNAYGCRSQVFELSEVESDSAVHADDDLIPARMFATDELPTTASRTFDAQTHGGSPCVNGGDSMHPSVAPFSINQRADVEMSLHPMHSFRLEAPIEVVEIESRVKVRTSPIPPKTQRRAIDVLIFDSHFGDTGHRRQHVQRFRSDHIGFNRRRFPFHHYRAAHNYFPLLQDAAVYARVAEQHVRNIGDPSHAASVVHCVKCDTFPNGKSAR